MVDNTNPRAVDFETWAAPALEEGEPRWLMRRLAVEMNHIGKNPKPVTA